MKKRILFVLTNLDTGGIIRSLQNFLNCYDSSIIDVDVFALTHQGAFRGELKKCNVLPCHRLLDASIARYEYQQGFAKIESLITKLLDKVTHYRFQSRLFKIVANGLIKNKHYDAVIGFSEGVPTQFVSVMNHSNKIGWIHCDYSSYMRLNGLTSEMGTYQKLQHIICVSNYTRKSFIETYPSLSDRTTFIYNVIDEVMMISKADESVEESFNDDCFNIVSVGRIDPVKRLSVIPELAARVSGAGLKIRWYIIGPKGTQEEYELLYNNINKYHVENVVLPLGEKANPYPYISKAKLLVNTSISEACPYVINEAKILKTPILCPDFGSAKEFITNGTYGYSIPIEQMADYIIKLVQEPWELQRMKNNLNGFYYDNESILRSIYSLI